MVFHFILTLKIEMNSRKLLLINFITCVLFLNLAKLIKRLVNQQNSISGKIKTLSSTDLRKSKMKKKLILLYFTLKALCEVHWSYIRQLFRNDNECKENVYCFIMKNGGWKGIEKMNMGCLQWCWNLPSCQHVYF